MVVVVRYSADSHRANSHRANLYFRFNCREVWNWLDNKWYLNCIVGRFFAFVSSSDSSLPAALPQRVLMASVYCKSCKAKITGSDVTCPNCGSPTSRKVTVVLFLAVVIAGVLLFNAYRQSTNNETSNVAGARIPVAASE